MRAQNEARTGKPTLNSYFVGLEVEPDVPDEPLETPEPLAPVEGGVIELELPLPDVPLEPEPTPAEPDVVPLVLLPGVLLPKPGEVLLLELALPSPEELELPEPMLEEPLEPTALLFVLMAELLDPIREEP